MILIIIFQRLLLLVLLYLWALKNTAQIPKCLFLLRIKPLRVYVTAPYSFLFERNLVGRDIRYPSSIHGKLQPRLRHHWEWEWWQQHLLCAVQRFFLLGRWFTDWQGYGCSFQQKEKENSFWCTVGVLWGGNQLLQDEKKETGTWNWGSDCKEKRGIIQCLVKEVWDFKLRCGSCAVHYIL